DQLPTVRQLAVGVRVNANTVPKVYTFLEREGVPETRPRVRAFIAARSAAAEPDAGAGHSPPRARRRRRKTRCAARSSRDSWIDSSRICRRTAFTWTKPCRCCTTGKTKEHDGVRCHFADGW